jgi:uncharacterized protein (DUF433 family)
MRGAGYGVTDQRNGILRRGAEIVATGTLDWSQCPAVESIPGKVSGAWVFRDTRLPVATVIENLEDLSVEEVMEQFDVTREQIAAVLEFVAQSLRVSAPTQISSPGRKIAIVVLTGTAKWSRVRLHLERIAAVVDAVTPGSYTEIPVPFDHVSA